MTLTTAEALAAGWSRGRLAGPGVRRLFPGVHLPVDQTLTLPVLVDGARRLLPSDALATSTTALRLLGVDAGTVAPLRFLTAHPHQVRRPGLCVTRTRLLPSAVDGVVPAAHAFVTSAALVDLVELVAAGDRLVRLGRTTPVALQAAASAYRGRRAVTARRAAALVRARSTRRRRPSSGSAWSWRPARARGQRHPGVGVRAPGPRRPAAPPVPAGPRVRGRPPPSTWPGGTATSTVRRRSRPSTGRCSG